MIGLQSKDNIDQVFAELDEYADAIRLVAVPRAINKVADQAQVAGLRKISDIYGLSPRTMEKYVTTKVAIAGRFEATLSATGIGFPMYVFSPRTIKGVGVSVLVKGKRIIIKRAFIATMPNGHVGIFARGAYGGKSAKFNPTGQAFGRFQYSRSRLAINELYTFSPADAFGNPEVVDAMDSRVAIQMPIVLAQEIKFATR